MIPLRVLITAAVILFVPLFIFRGVGPLDFWWWISLNIILLICAAIFTDTGYRKELANILKGPTLFNIFMGIAGALFLYGVFFTGNLLSRLIFDFADAGIEAVYSFRGEASPLRIGLLMLIIIGPGEELLWRGYFQKHFMDKMGPWMGFFTGALFYTSVHIASLNPMLILAALTCGIFWGFMYMRYRSLLMVCVSHTLWDIGVFILFPFS